MSNWVGKFYTDRITLTPPVLNNAACVIFLVSGEDKALPLKAVLEGPYEPEQLPAQLIRPEPWTVAVARRPAGCELVTLVMRMRTSRLSEQG